MIAAAMPGQLEELGGLAAAFYAASRFLRGFDLQRFAAFWTPLIESGMGAVFIDRDAGGQVTGAIGGVLYPEPYSGELVATEFFWFVAPESRGGGLRLYRAFERWARDAGATQCRMVHLADSMPDKLSRLYQRLGYEPAETHFVKEIK